MRLEDTAVISYDVTSDTITPMNQYGHTLQPIRIHVSKKKLKERISVASTVLVILPQIIQ